MAGLQLWSKGWKSDRTEKNIFKLLLFLLLGLPFVANAQLTFTTNNGAIIITGCVGNPTSLEIPSMTNGYPVVSITIGAFTAFFTSLTNVTIPNTVTNIG